MFVYETKFLFDVQDETQADGWTSDCGGEQDFNPTIIRLSSCVYPDGDWIASVYVGGDTQLCDTGIMKAGNVRDAKRAVEDWSNEKADAIIAAVKAALS